MSFRSSVFSVCLAAACSAFGFIPANDYGVVCGPVTNSANLKVALDMSMKKGYVVGQLRHAIVEFRGDASSALSVDDIRASVATLQSGRVYPLSPVYAIFGKVKKNFPEYVSAWVTASSNDFPITSQFILSAPNTSWIALVPWAFDHGAPGLALGEINRSLLYADAYMEQYAVQIKKVCTRQVKIMLRRNGKSFVTRDGVNPLEPYAKRLETILNAPRMHGMVDFCAEIGLPTTYAIPEDSFMTDDEIKKICDKIMIDDEDIKRFGSKLRYSMGTDAYNAFVKVYNEGDAQ